MTATAISAVEIPIPFVSDISVKEDVLIFLSEVCTSEFIISCCFNQENETHDHHVLS